MTERTYRIGEAAALLDLKAYVLRFWETEFPQLRPLRTEKGQRLYTSEHVALLKKIKNLLYDCGMTIEGARRVLDAPDQGDAVSGAILAESASAGNAGGVDACGEKEGAFLFPVARHVMAELRAMRTILSLTGENR